MLINEIKRNLDTLMAIKKIRNPTHLAEMSGIPQPTLSRMLSGKHKTIELDTVRKLARFFGISIDVLIGDDPLTVGDTYKINDEFRIQLDWFYKNLSDENKHALVAHANLLWSVEHPTKSKANPFPPVADVLPLLPTIKRQPKRHTR